MVSEHRGYNTSRSILFLETYGEDTHRCPHKDYNGLNRWQTNWDLLSTIYFSVMTHL
jgi:hypothetical protein